MKGGRKEDHIDPDRIRGALYGQAVGDAFGLPYEYLTPEQICELWPIRPKDQYLPSHRPSLGEAFAAGEFSDDTAQALALIDAFFDGEGRRLEPRPVARRIAGTAGKGMGKLTRRIVSDPAFLEDPIRVAKRIREQICEETGRYPHTNGAVMRASGLGLLRPHDTFWTAGAAGDTAEVTHPDGECRASAIAVAVAVAVLVVQAQVPERIQEHLTAEEIIGEAVRLGAHYAYASNGPVGEMVRRAFRPRPLASPDDPSVLSWLSLGGRKYWGDTRRTVSAGFWALSQANRGFLAPLEDIVQAGGDTDTNAAVAGALLGAALGFAAIPTWMVEGLVERDALEVRLAKIQALHGRPS